MANLAKELIVIFDLQNAFHIQKMRRLLYKYAFFEQNPYNIIN